MNAGVALRLPDVETESCAAKTLTLTPTWDGDTSTLSPSGLENMWAALKLTAKTATQIQADSNRATDISEGLHLYSSTEH